jgi:hypothetical protein
VGSTLMAVEAVDEDLTAVDEAVAWTRRRWTRRGVEAHTEKERACDVNPARLGRRSARTGQLWRRGGGRGAVGHVGGDEMRKNSSARV